MKTRIKYIILLVALLTWPMASPYDSSSVFDPQPTPSLAHPLGTDVYGSDILIQLATATSINVKYALSALFPFLIFGISFGLILGYLSNDSSKVDDQNNGLLAVLNLTVKTVTELFQSIPAALVVVFGILVVNNAISNPGVRIYLV